MNKKEFGRFIHTHRKAKGLSLKSVAHSCGVSVNFISMIERGLKKPSDKVVKKLSLILDVEEKILFELLDKIPPEVMEAFTEVHNEHEGFKKLLLEVRDKVENDTLRHELFDEVYSVYADFLKRHHLNDKE